MVSHLFFYQLTLIALVWLCVMLQWAWPSDPATWPPTPEPTPPVPKRHREPTPFAGLTTKPHYAACEHRTDPHPSPLSRVGFLKMVRIPMFFPSQMSLSLLPPDVSGGQGHLQGRPERSGLLQRRDGRPGFWEKAPHG